MDEYYSPAWVEAHPELQKLWERLNQSPEFRLITYWEDIYFQLDKGVGGSGSRLMLSMSPHRQDLGSVAIPWITADCLSELEEDLKREYRLDLVMVMSEEYIIP